MGWFTTDIVSNIEDWKGAFEAQRVANENERKDIFLFAERNGLMLGGLLIISLIIISLRD